MSGLSWGELVLGQWVLSHQRTLDHREESPVNMEPTL